MGYVILGVIIFIVLLIVAIVVLSFVIKGFAEKVKKQKEIIALHEEQKKKYEKYIEGLNRADEKKNSEVSNLNETKDSSLIDRANNLF